MRVVGITLSKDAKEILKAVPLSRFANRNQMFNYTIVNYWKPRLEKLKSKPVPEDDEE